MHPAAHARTRSAADAPSLNGETLRDTNSSFGGPRPHAQPAQLQLAIDYLPTAHLPTALLVPQRLDRVEPRRFPRRVEAKDDPDARRDDDRADDRHDRNGGR